jgi:hypothetical protein
METADTPGKIARSRYPNLEGRIRTLSISLVAVAALVVSMTIARQREVRQPGPGFNPDRAPASDGLNLDAIRSAGL